VSERRTGNKVDLAGMRTTNERMLLRMIWSRPGISRADLARESGLSASTVSGIVRRFEDDGLVRRTRARVSSGGRPPVELVFDDAGHHIAGIEIGASHLTAVLASPTGAIVAARDQAFATRTDPYGAIETAAEMLRDCLAGSEYRGAVLGVGVAVPSPIDLRWPDRVSPMILPAWRDIDIAEEFGDRVALPVYVENDANAGALAEHWFGQGGDDFTYIKIGTGIGSGHVIRGALYRGAGGIAGELGHLSIDPSGPTCICGNRGCLNVMVGTPRLLELAAERCSGAAPRSARELAARSAAGEPWAVELMAEVGQRLGIGVAGLLNLLNPSRVVLGGELVAAGDAFLDAVRASARSRSLLFSNHQAELAATVLGESAIALGAATLALDAAFEDHELLVHATAGGLR